VRRDIVSRRSYRLPSQFA